MAKKKLKTLTPEIIETENPAYLRFAAAYIQSGSIKATCQTADYPESYGSDLLRLPSVRREISRLRESLEKASDFTVEAAFQRLSRMALAFEASGNAMAAVRAVEMCAKMAGHLSLESSRESYRYRSDSKVTR